MELRPHDLLRLRSADAVDLSSAPDWVRMALEAAPWVVVRRAPGLGERIAIGVRGATRAERHAGFVAFDAVVEGLAPEDLRDREPPRAHPVFAALGSIRDRLRGSALAWGPAGGAGFELATGRSALTDVSDLDLVLRLGGADESVLKAFTAAIGGSPVRVDALVETSGGAFALGEYFSDGDEILLRTASGPRLVRKAGLVRDRAA